MRWALLAVLFIVAASPPASLAGEADVVSVDVTRTDDGTLRFDVTVRHDDSGWDHYASRWEVLGPGGELLAVRRLAHPHVGEQPFTRSLSGVKIPDGISRVVVRAHDSLHGYGGASLALDLPP